MKVRRRARVPHGKDEWRYKQLWRIVDGAVADAFAMHPGYLSGKWPERVVRESICKRVTGSVLGYAEQSARGRSAEEAAAIEAADSVKGSVADAPPNSQGASRLGRVLAWLAARRGGFQRLPRRA